MKEADAYRVVRVANLAVFTEVLLIKAETPTQQPWPPVAGQVTTIGITPPGYSIQVDLASWH